MPTPKDNADAPLEPGISIFSFELVDLRDFDCNRLDCFATMAYETQTLVGIQLDENGCLSASKSLDSDNLSRQWRLESDHLAVHHSVTHTVCKLTFCTETGTRIGTVSLDLRTAGCNAGQIANTGEWLTLDCSGSSKPLTPKALIRYTYKGGVGAAQSLQKEPTAEQPAQRPMKHITGTPCATDSPAKRQLDAAVQAKAPASHTAVQVRADAQAVAVQTRSPVHTTRQEITQSTATGGDAEGYGNMEGNVIPTVVNSGSEAQAQQHGVVVQQQQQSQSGEGIAAVKAKEGHRGADVVPSELEIKAAYELEIWRTQEEAKFKEQLQATASSRLQELETEWQQKEQQRKQEHDEACSRYSVLESKAKGMLDELHAWEARLMQTERDLDKQKLQLEKQADRSVLDTEKRIIEVEGALEKLRIECSSQVELERTQALELSKAKTAAEARCQALEERCTQLTQTIQTLQETYDNSQEAALKREVAELRRELERTKSSLTRSETKLHKAIQARDKYKEQIVRMGQDLGALQQALQVQLQELLTQQQQQAAAAAVASIGPRQKNGDQLNRIQQLRTSLHAMQRGSPQKHKSSKSIRKSSSRPYHGCEYLGSPEASEEERERERERQQRYAARGPPRADDGCEYVGSPSASADEREMERQARYAARGPYRKNYGCEYRSDEENEFAKLMKQRIEGEQGSSEGDDSKIKAQRPTVAVESNGSAGPSSTTGAPAKGPSAFDPLSEIKRLVAEREMLLESGSYTRQDKFIQELDTVILQLMATTKCKA